MDIDFFNVVNKVTVHSGWEFYINFRELETLTNTNLNPGTYIIDWDASSYPSGVYLIRMESGRFTDRQKVALVK